MSLWITQDINHRKVLRLCSVDGELFDEVDALVRGGAHVKLSDFNHIYGLKNERVSPPVFAKDGGEERDWLNLLVVRRPSVVQEKYPIQQGETRSTIPKYALYSPAMHC